MLKLYNLNSSRTWSSLFQQLLKWIVTDRNRTESDHRYWQKTVQQYRDNLKFGCIASHKISLLHNVCYHHTLMVAWHDAGKLTNVEVYITTENCVVRRRQAIINQKIKTNATKIKTRLKNWSSACCMLPGGAETIYTYITFNVKLKSYANLSSN